VLNASFRSFSNSYFEISLTQPLCEKCRREQLVELLLVILSIRRRHTLCRKELRKSGGMVVCINLTNCGGCRETFRK